MSVVFIALPFALLLALAGVIAFIWSVRSGQLDDLETPALRLLGEDDERKPARCPDPPREPSSREAGNGAEDR
jgi:cbb3-type cytochrome oxidase maturation protein